MEGGEGVKDLCGGGGVNFFLACQLPPCMYMVHTIVEPLESGHPEMRTPQ